jgi:hypothetical protein
LELGRLLLCCHCSRTGTGIPALSLMTYEKSSKM